MGQKVITYTRVSTTQQGASGLGLEAQEAAVSKFIAAGDWELVGEYQEIETGKGANALEKRPQLRAALDACKNMGAVLIIAKLDRLARNVHFVTGLIESGVDFIACDMPQANKVMIQMHAVMSEWERDQISARTKAALAAAKGRGVVLGKAGAANLKPNVEARKESANAFAEGLRPILEPMQGRKITLAVMAGELNRANVRTATGRGLWSAEQVRRVLKKISVQKNVEC